MSSIPKDKQKLHILDSIIILLNISATYSIIPYILFTSNRGYNNLILFFIDIIYLTIRFNFNKLPKHLLFYSYTLIFLLNAIFSLITSSFAYGLFSNLALNITFYLILFYMFNEYSKEYSYEKSVWLISRGYIWLSIYCVIVIWIMFIIITFINVNPFINNIESKMDLFKNNVESFGGNKSTYYFPYNISIFYRSSDIRIPFLQQYGFITGIYHEPHIVSFLITPAFFILLHYVKAKWGKICAIIGFSFVLLISASTMNIISLLICYVIYLVIKYGKNIFLFIGIITFNIAIILSLNKNLYEFILLKLKSESKDYSIQLIQFAISPKTILGTNFLDLSYLENLQTKNYDVGYIIFALNISFLFVCYFKLFYILKNSKTRFVGFAILFFFLHSAKLAMSTYLFTTLIFFIFLLHISFMEIKKNKIIYNE